MVDFEKRIFAWENKNHSLFLPGWVTDESIKDKKNFCKGFFKDETDKYTLIGSGSYYFVSGNIPEIYKWVGGFKEDDSFSHYILKGIVLFHDNEKNFLCGGTFGNYSKESFLDTKKCSPLDFLFIKEDGSIARTDEDKNVLIEECLKSIRE